MYTKMNKKSFILVFFLSLLNFASFDSIASSTDTSEPLSAKNWFKNNYAPLWKNDKNLQLVKLKEFYHEAGFMRDRGQLIQWQMPSTLEQLITMEKDKGWQTSKIISIQTQQINQSSSALTVVWQSEYSDQSVEISCEWYLADLEGENWIFTQHRFIDCLQ